MAVPAAVAQTVDLIDSDQIDHFPAVLSHDLELVEEDLRLGRVSADL